MLQQLLEQNILLRRRGFGSSLPQRRQLVRTVRKSVNDPPAEVVVMAALLVSSP